MKTRALLLLVVLGTAAMAHAKKDTGFLDRSLKIGGVTYRYQVYVPDGWNKSAKWPVVLFLHGAGERGDDGVVQTQVGIGTAIRWHRDRFPCIVVMPQCRRNIWWPDPKMEEMALKALDAAVKEFRGDPQRLYLTASPWAATGPGAWPRRIPGSSPPWYPSAAV